MEMLERWKDFLDGVSSLFSIGNIVFSILIYVFYRIADAYRLKKFLATRRPLLLSEQEFYNAICNQYIKTRLKSEEGEKYTFKSFVKKIIIEEKKQYHVILGEAGVGKSLFLINLYYRYNRKFFRGYHMEYIPLRSKNALQEIRKIKDSKKTVLLLDAFDESSEANCNASQFIKKIEEETGGFAKVIISSRNNFFNKENDIPSIVHLDRNLSLSEEKYSRYYIQPFTNSDVCIYLIRKYKLSLCKFIKSMKVVSCCGDFICRPLVISYIDLLIKGDNTYKNLADVYFKIIDSWIKRETYYIARREKEYTQEEIETKLFLFISKISIFMYENYPITREYSIKIEDLNKIENANFLEKTEGKRNRSLFNRIDEELIFAHKSILEYMLAVNFDKLDFRYETNLSSLYKFLKDMVGKNYDTKYSSLFYVNFADTSPEVIDNGEELGELKVSSVIHREDRKFIEAMVWWYHRAQHRAVFINNKLYLRKAIQIKLQDRYIIKISSKMNPLATIEKIMKIIKLGIANRTAIDLKVITILCEFPEHGVDRQYYVAKK